LASRTKATFFLSHNMCDYTLCFEVTNLNQIYFSKHGTINGTSSVTIIRSFLLYPHQDRRLLLFPPPLTSSLAVAYKMRFVSLWPFTVSHWLRAFSFYRRPQQQNFPTSNLRFNAHGREVIHPILVLCRFS
jgi:hypothetical protein